VVELKEKAPSALYVHKRTSERRVHSKPAVQAFIFRNPHEKTNNLTALSSWRPLE
jgi:hypothetical protein